MGAVTRKITVIVDGESVGLQEAASKGVDSLKLMADAAVQSSAVAADANARTITSNAALTESFARTAASTKASSVSMSEALTGALTEMNSEVEFFAKRSYSSMVAAGEQMTAAVESYDAKMAESQAASYDAMLEDQEAFTTAATAQLAAFAERRAAVMLESDEKIAAAQDALVTDYDAANAAMIESAAKQATAANAAADDNVKAAVKSSAASDASSKKSVASFAASGSGLVRLGKLTTEAAAAVAVGSLYMSSKFESSTTRLLTQAGATESQIKTMRSSILSMAGDLGQTPEKLSEGLYHIVSSMNKVLPPATRTSEELKIMAVAAKGAAVGNTSMEETTYALASAMNALHQHAGDAEHTMSLLNAIVGSGDMTMGDLLAALKSGLIPTAKTFGVSLQSVGSALAVMGDQGMRGALAGTRLRMALSLIAAPSEKAAEVMDALGMSAGAISARTKGMAEALGAAGLSTTTMAADLRKPDGITVALKDLWTHLEKAGLSATEVSDVFGRAFGGGRMSATTELLAQSVGRVGIKYEQIGHQVGDFGKDWGKTQETLSFQAKQAEAAIEALGVKIGHDLTPAAETAMHDLEGMAKWLEHNKTAAELLAGTITGVLGVAVTAFVANRVAKMVEGLKQLGSASSWLRSGFGATAATTGTRSVATAATGGLGETMGGMIGGSRSGYGLPGSMVNPIVVAVESGEYAGLGGESAAIGANSATAGENAAETASARSGEETAVVARGAATRDAEAASVPTVVAKEEEQTAPITRTALPAVVAPAEESDAESTALMTTLRTGVGTVMDNAMKGGMIALMGSFASEIAKSAIGGKKGETVGDIGKDTALGAALGTAIEPGIGTAIGAGFGGVLGAIKAIRPPTQAENKAHKLAGGPGKPDLGAKLEKDENNYFSLLGSQLAKLKPAEDRSAAEQHIAHTDESKLGPLIGGDLGKAEAGYVLEGTKNPDFGSIVETAQRDLKKLPPMGRQAFTEAIKQMVETLQKEGRLPHDALAKMLNDLKPELAGLPALAGTTASNFSHELASNLHMQEAQSKLAGTSKQISEEWGRNFDLLPVASHMSLTEVETTTGHDMGILRGIMKSGTAQQVDEAKAEYAKLKDSLANYVSAASGSVQQQLKGLSEHTGPLAHTAVENVIDKFQELPLALKEQMEHAGGTVEKGIDKINKILFDELQKINPGGVATLKEGGAPLAPGVEKHAQEVHHEAAKGGLFQLGRPGEAGKDTIPLNVGGIPIVAGKGETVAVFTRHQRAAAESSIPGGLPGIFANKTPNYMAEGGFVAEPGTNFSVGYEPRIVADLRKFSAEMKQIVYGISGYRTPQQSAALPKGNSGDPHTEAKAADVGLGAPTIASMIPVPEGDLRKVGLYRPFYPPDPTEANHVQLIGVPFGPGSANSGMPAGAGSAGVATAQPWTTIKTPQVGGSGVLQAIVQAVLGKAAKAANAKGEAAAGTTGGSTSEISGFSGAWTQVMAQIAARKHWSLPDWKGVVSLESAGNPQARNKSGAFGLGQALGATKTEYPKMVSPNPSTQIEGMAEYIASRYGNPSAALAHEHAYHWYEEGGFLPAGTGTPDAAAASSRYYPKPTTTKPKSQKTLANAAKPHPSKGKKGSSAKLKVPSFLALAKNLKNVPEAANIATHLGVLEKHLKAKQEEEGLLSSMESQPAQIMPGDMQFLNPYMQGMGIRPGMTVSQAENSREVWLQHNESNPNSDLMGELLSWIGGLDNHRLLSAGDVGILSPFYAESGVSLPVGYPIFAGQTQLLTAQEHQETSMHNVIEKGVERIHELGSERRAREMSIERIEKREYERIKTIKAAIAKITTSSLHEGLKAAEASHLHSELESDATSTRGSYKAEIREEEARTLPDKQLIAELKAREESIVVPANLGTSAVSKARLALVKNELTNDLTPSEEVLYNLGGSKTTIGKSGLYGKVEEQRKGLEAANNELRPKLGEEVSAISSLKMTAQGIAEAAQNQAEEPRPVIMPGTGTEENSALTEALEQENEILSKNLATETSQFYVLKNFEMNLPHFEKGGPVLEDGPIYAHKGEHVVPREGALVANGAGNVSIEHTQVFQGELGPLMKLVDERVQHPDNVRVISRQMAQRTQNFPGFRR